MISKDLELRRGENDALYLNYWSIYGNDRVFTIDASGKVFRHTWVNPDDDEPTYVEVDLVRELQELAKFDDSGGDE